MKFFIKKVNKHVCVIFHQKGRIFLLISIKTLARSFLLVRINKYLHNF